MVDVNKYNLYYKKIIYVSESPLIWEKINPGWLIQWYKSQIFEYKFRENIDEKSLLDPYIGIVLIHPLILEANILKKVKEYDNEKLRENILNMLYFKNKEIKELVWYDENRENIIDDELQSNKIIQLKVILTDDKEQFIRIEQYLEDKIYKPDNKTIVADENNIMSLPIDNKTIVLKDGKLVAIESDYPLTFNEFMAEHYPDFKRIALLLRPRFKYDFTYCGKNHLLPNQLELYKNRALNLLDIYICVNNAKKGELDKVLSNIIDWYICENNTCEKELPERLKYEIFELSKRCHLHRKNGKRC